MAKNTLLKVLNPILAVLVLTQALSGLLAEHLPHETFEVVHGGGGLLLVVGVVLHVLLNWSWVRTNFRPRPGRT